MLTRSEDIAMLHQTVRFPCLAPGVIEQLDYSRPFDMLVDFIHQQKNKKVKTINLLSPHVNSLETAKF